MFSEVKLPAGKGIINEKKMVMVYWIICGVSTGYWNSSRVNKVINSPLDFCARVSTKIISLLLFLPMALSQWHAVPLLFGWIYLVGIGLTFVGSQLLVILAYRLASPTRLSPLMYITLITAILDWLIWHEVPTLLVFAGMALVVIGGVITVGEKAAGNPTK